MVDGWLALQLVANGLATGFLYALLAIGITLIWKSVAVGNFAQGDFATFGMFAALVLIGPAQLALPTALVGAVVLTGGLGILVERLALRRIRDAHALTKILATIGVSIVIANGLRLAFGPMPRRLPALWGLAPLRWGPVVLVPQHLGSAATAVVLLTLLHWLFTRTLMGKALRAQAENREAASLVGINPNHMARLAFALSAALGATAGVLIAPLVFVVSDMEFNLLIKALLAALIGGFGSYPGALLGGLIIGVLDNVSSFYVSSDFRDAISFGCLIVLLMVKPTGLLGKPLREI